MPEPYSPIQQFIRPLKSNGRKSRCALRAVSEEDEFPSSSLLNNNSTLLRETTMYALTQACRLLVQRVRKDQKMWKVDRDGDVVVYPRRSLHDSEYSSSPSPPAHKPNSSPSFDEESVSRFRFSFTIPLPPTSESGDDTQEGDDSTKMKERDDCNSAEESSSEETIWRKFSVLSVSPDPSSHSSHY
ncbi:uncharacterized protein BT62DRAFT_1061774 [Guyanagaster necrorhizus]|uniref:Uncharacterized protein n=1 Tax=Guyanagaster necrorhizus TaxID=856835 RepID=A0A9P8AKF4_9AGAR|nr:uncharacterized protein BT62DRAFT_1061774 [Guyanagaster necrorhizus MCA 3950]KAG7439158.1 hypothetical protein BT62DRAFT_1061774 [Guyanagaster necrorhizus MCA 3950]